MKTKKGFTLIELMVAMGIIAVLVTMSVVAIQIVQRSLRDTQRRDIINTVNLWLAGHYNDNGRYPPTAEIVFGTDTVEYQPPSASAVEIADLAGATRAGSTESTTSQTAYCYAVTPGGGSYRLGVLLESGADVQLGNGGDCTSF